MNLSNLFEQLQAASTKAKLIAAGLVLASVAIVTVGGVVATRPHYKLIRSELTDRENAAAQRALAEAGVRFRVSEPPGPYVLYVDENQEFEALRAIAISGALDPMTRGIATNSDGPMGVFMSSGERSQAMQKRDWQEAEKILESFEFVRKAQVRTNAPDSSPFRPDRPRSGSVTLTLTPGTSLSRQQRNNVAKVVQNHLDIDPDRLVVTNQYGDSLWTSEEQGDALSNPSSLLDYAKHYNEMRESAAMKHLAAAYGDGRVQVSVVSEWNHDQTTSILQSPDTDKVVRESETSKTETPTGGGSSVGGPAGAASNFGIDSAQIPADALAGQKAPVATSKEERTVYETGRETRHVLHVGPDLKRMYVSVLVDQKLEEELGSDAFRELERVVKAAVGFSDERDTFDIGRAPFASLEPELDEDGNPIVVEEEPAPNPMIDTLLERGVEIVCALAFVIVLLKSLKGGRSDANATPQTGPAAAPAGAAEVGEVETEDIVLSQVEGLVRNDPERVGKILSRWAREEVKAGS